MVGPIFDEWKISDLELESEVGSDEVDVAISGRNVGRDRSWGGRDRSWGGRGTTLVVGETSTAGQGWGVGVKIPFCSVIIEFLTFCRRGIGQCTNGRGGAESVLTLSSTPITVELNINSMPHTNNTLSHADHLCLLFVTCSKGRKPFQLFFSVNFSKKMSNSNSSVYV